MPHRYSDSAVLRGLIAHRVAGDDTALANDEIVRRFSTGESADILEALAYEGLVEFEGERPDGTTFWRATDEALELAKGPKRPLRRYAHILVDIDEGAGAPFDALEAAVNAVPGCATMGTTIPTITTDTESRAEGFIEAAAEAHDIDLDDEHGSALYAEAVEALTVLLNAPRRSLG
jgi:hypothetical protein